MINNNKWWELLINLEYEVGHVYNKIKIQLYGLVLIRYDNHRTLYYGSKIDKMLNVQNSYYKQAKMMLLYDILLNNIKICEKLIRGLMNNVFFSFILF